MVGDWLYLATIDWYWLVLAVFMNFWIIKKSVHHRLFCFYPTV